jgi:3-oxoacyl-[acyl-carrier protein] reductase
VDIEPAIKLRPSGMVACLAGPEARFVTGAALTIDGGYLA